MSGIGFLTQKALTPSHLPRWGIYTTMIEQDPKIGAVEVAIAPVGSLAPASGEYSSELALGVSPGMVVPVDWDDLRTKKITVVGRGGQESTMGLLDYVEVLVGQLASGTFGVQFGGSISTTRSKMPRPSQDGEFQAVLAPKEILAAVDLAQFDHALSLAQRRINDVVNGLGGVQFDIVPIGLGILTPEGEWARRPGPHVEFGPHRGELEVTSLDMRPAERRERFAGYLLMVGALQRMIEAMAPVYGENPADVLKGLDPDDWMALCNTMVHAYVGEKGSITFEENYGSADLMQMIPSMVGLPWSSAYPFSDGSRIRELALDPKTQGMAGEALSALWTFNTVFGYVCHKYGGITVPVRLRHTSKSNRKEAKADFPVYWGSDIQYDGGSEVPFMMPPVMRGVRDGLLWPSRLDEKQSLTLGVKQPTKLGSVGTFTINNGVSTDFPSGPDTRGWFRPVVSREGLWGTVEDRRYGQYAMLSIPCSREELVANTATFLLQYLSDASTMPGSGVKVSSKMVKSGDGEAPDLLWSRRHMALGMVRVSEEVADIPDHESDSDEEVEEETDATGRVLPKDERRQKPKTGGAVRNRKTKGKGKGQKDDA